MDNTRERLQNIYFVCEASRHLGGASEFRSQLAPPDKLSHKLMSSPVCVYIFDLNPGIHIFNVRLIRLTLTGLSPVLAAVRFLILMEICSTVLMGIMCCWMSRPKRWNFEN